LQANSAQAAFIQSKTMVTLPETQATPSLAVRVGVSLSVKIANGQIVQETPIQIGYGTFLSKTSPIRCVSDVMNRLIMLVFLGGCIGVPVSAQDASYDATISFLGNKLNVNNNRTIQSISFPERCYVSLSERSRESAWYGGKFEYVSEVNLADLDPSSIRADTNSLVVFARERREVVSVKVYNRYDDRSSYSQNRHEVDQTPRCNSDTLVCEGSDTRNNISIPLTLSPVAENFQRVGRAMSHLISLCGGQEELF
jgi:hypothetical protein